ncbi:MAG TPA: hypothetical protein VEY70_24075 [Metabacillus sp.]|nr:hypothetical protein [Metabacillus sp.]
MTTLLLFGLIAIMIMMIFKNQIWNIFGERNQLVKKLVQAAWFQNHWLAGLSLFGINAGLFFLTIALLYLLMYLVIPYIHLIIMSLAVIASLYVWIVINKAWGGSQKNRLKLGAVGSSFYLLLTMIFVYMIISLEPNYPGEDTFMRFIGLFFAAFVTIVAFFTCFMITGFSKSK